MNRLVKMCRRTWTWSAVLALWFLASPVVVCAQDASGSSDEGSSYVNQYALMILLVAVAILAIARPSRRATEIKAQ